MKTAAILSSGLIAIAGLVAGCSGTQSRFSPAQPERAAEINLSLAADYLRKGDLRLAKEKIERALEQNPGYGRAHGVAALLYDKLGDDRRADSHFRRAVSLDPRNPEIKNNYAVYLCQKDRFERGEKLALEAAADPLYRTREIGYLNAGNCARNDGQARRAEEHYRQALDLQPRFGEALLRLADLEYEQGEYLSARAFLQRYLAVGRTSPATLWLGVRIERSLGNHTQAQYYAQRLRSEYPGAVQTRELLESERNPG